MNKRIHHQQQHATGPTMLCKPPQHTPGIEIAVQWTAGHAAATAAEFDRVAARVRAEIVESATRDGNDTHEQDTATADAAAAATGAADGRAADGFAAGGLIRCECPGGAGRCGDCRPPHLGDAALHLLRRPCGKDVGDGTMRPCGLAYGHADACTATEGAAPDVDLDEALAQALRDTWWASTADGPKRRWRNIARTALDHIEGSR